MQKGDFILVHGNGFFDKVIQFGQSLRFPASDSYWNHVALIISDTGDLVEAASKGVQLSHISKYKEGSYQIIATNLTPEDQAEAVGFALSSVSDGYGWTTIVSTALCLLVGLKFSFGFSSEDICSGLVARCLEHGGKILNRDAIHTTPADLAKTYLI